jgi:predicted ribosome quality control (RQC) complex YloA/Tae2 family protein
MTVAIDMRLNDSRYLFISVESSDPRVYLIRRRLRDLEKQSGTPTVFVLLLRKYLANSFVRSVSMLENERVIDIELTGETELGETVTFHLIIQLTGRSANLFLTDNNRRIIDSLRDTNGDGQLDGDIYAPPTRPTGTSAPVRETPAFEGSISEFLDTRDIEKQAALEFKALVRSAQVKVDREISKQEKLRKALNADLTRHGDAGRWKHFGDLLLANVATATRNGNLITVVDYFSDALPKIEIEAEQNNSITEAAEKYFRKYTRARNAAEEIKKRLGAVKSELERLSKRLEAIALAEAEQDTNTLLSIAGTSSAITGTKREREKVTATTAVARSFTSSDGFEILVGKRAKDNDVLTFKVAKSLDTWMHAADYPGSHVVVRNPNRKEIPIRTLLEAAQLAAFYSQGKAQPKAAVHYTQKKFVNKPKGAAPGLVSLASFKTLLVEPVVPEFGN